MEMGGGMVRGGVYINSVSTRSRMKRLSEKIRMEQREDLTTIFLRRDYAGLFCNF